MIVCFAEHPIDFVFEGNVGLDRPGLPPLALNFSDRLLRSGLVPVVVDNDAGAAVCQCDRNRPADATTAAGHQRVLSREIDGCGHRRKTLTYSTE